MHAAVFGGIDGVYIIYLAAIHAAIFCGGDESILVSRGNQRGGAIESDENILISDGGQRGNQYYEPGQVTYGGCGAGEGIGSGGSGYGYIY